ncbi:helix-turn-helix transcriptional regulator [Streptomyces sp. CB01881]|uniref:helix-turn-helix domain-containing protein n=1 Tax=Streptomyces sp. CB01881 TaxID=2078691 RepID=UPI000CDC04D7|nr:helix-turn-helix transcriptional regulator [Streptomyces sp. CB01881]AUY48400.1 XRE family transcriptional regulator [Streptomyces sp. CB01881]TYC76889.1 helix-turn-helix domain-containing protein [Streptomyces sp. CB01881]
MARPDPRSGIRWHWTTPRAQAILSRRSLPQILTFYRELHHLPQEELGALLGYSTSYISRVETGSRTITDIGALRHIAERLQLPPHVFGITDDADGDHHAVIQFADSVLRLAEIVRQAGQAAAAVDELWPLVARLEARAADGHTETDVLRLLARARVSLGVALGHVLPEERLATAARWTGKGTAIARRLGDRSLHAYALRHHGNELRKARMLGPALDRLALARDLANTPEERAEAVILLARAAGSAGHTAAFDSAVAEGRGLLDAASATPLFSEFTHHEVHLRGLAGTGRISEAAALLDRAPYPGLQTTAQWQIISAITAGQVLARQGDRSAAREQMTAAVKGAAMHRLPHQLQRVVRASRGLPEVREEAEAALARLRAAIAA